MSKTFKDDDGRRSRHFTVDFRKKHELDDAETGTWAVPGDLLGAYDAERARMATGSMRFGNKRQAERKLKDHGRRRERRQADRELFHEVMEG